MSQRFTYKAWHTGRADLSAWVCIPHTVTPAAEGPEVHALFPLPRLSPPYASAYHFLKLSEPSSGGACESHMVTHPGRWEGEAAQGSGLGLWQQQPKLGPGESGWKPQC